MTTLSFFVLSVLLVVFLFAGCQSSQGDSPLSDGTGNSLPDLKGPPKNGDYREGKQNFASSQDDIFWQRKRKKLDLNNGFSRSPLALKHIDANAWRTSASSSMVFRLIARIIARKYILVTIDKENMTLQTDWDKFFIDGRLFRNRMSVTVFSVDSGKTEVVIRNSVEYHADQTQAKQDEASFWLPSPDITDEVERLVENINQQLEAAAE